MSFSMRLNEKMKQRVNDRILALPELIMKETENLAKEIGNIGEKRIKKYIIESETPFSRAAQSAGLNKGSGRRRTGKMYNSVSYKTVAFKSKTRILVGWIKSSVPKYYRYQESGFKNRFKAAYSAGGALRVKGGKPVLRMLPNGEFNMTKGMFAIRDTRFDLEKMIPKLKKQYIKNIVQEMKRI